MRTTSWGVACALWGTLAWMAACGDDDGLSLQDASGQDAGGQDAGGQDSGSQDAGGLDGGLDASLDGAAPDPAPKGKLRGRVTYADGTAIGQVNVRIRAKVYRSDSRGVFAADDLDEGEHEVAIEDSRASGAQVRVNIRRDQQAQAELFVLPLKTAPVADAQAGAELAGEDNLRVRVPAAGLRRKGVGMPASGAAETRYAKFKQNQDVKAAPGRMKAIMADREVDLESFGMIDLRIVQGEEELELAAEAELDLPLGPNTLADQSEISAWSFDRTMGRWRREGAARIDKSAGGNGVAKLRVAHLSWWTVAEPIAGQTCLSGKLLTDQMQPLPYVWVQAVGSDYWGSFAAVTDEQGQFCLNVKQGSTNTLSAFGLYATSYFEWEQTVSAGATAAACGAVGCTDVGNVTGASLFDECTGDVTSNENHVLVLSSGETNLDTLVEQALEGAGHTVTVGVPFHQFDGTVDLGPYDAIYLQANANWNSGDMPVTGQRQLINWVNCGGGLVTTEWTTWKIGSSTFQLIDAIFPAARTTAYGSPAMETYVKVTPDPTLNAGLPDSFTFTTSNFSGSESNLNPRPGAVVYYDSAMLDAGLLGWSYNLGRVASLSMCVGTNELADVNFARLVANTLDWAQRD